jgi:glycosyltransferase involved in cell wall biosynthesis
LNTTLLNIILKYWKPDIAHLHWHHSSLLASDQYRTIVKSVFFLSQLLVLKILRIKFVWTVHNLTHHENRHNHLELFFCKYIGQLADAVITHCETAKTEACKAFNLKQNKKVFVIPHGNYLGIYNSAVKETEAKKYLGIAENRLLFLFFGEIRPYKGIQELIHAFKKIDEKKPRSLSLMIAGRPINNQFAEKLKTLVNKSPNITLNLKSIPKNELAVYLKAANIIVFPFKKVLTSGSVLLALSFGKPIIAPTLGCIQDVLDKHGSFLYDPKDAKGLYRAMEKAIIKQSNLQQMSIYNIERANKFNWQDIASRTHHVYMQILRK